ncbi:MAG: hypothetical protein NTV80_04175, partial [Verrucomicrobia bacterium]|nr:hypothetical protein [Verrucomicrobiota bacterium]
MPRDQSPNVASVVVENNQLKLTGLAAGTRSVTVTATDLDNKPISQTFSITVIDGYQAPRIIKQPVSQTITATTNTTATFSVEALGSGLSYQWRRNEIPITTGTSATLTLTNPTSGLTTVYSSAATPGSYDVIISNSNSSQTSAKATLTIRSPITITKQPITQSVLPGARVTLSVTATGTGLSYRWRRNEIDLVPAQTGSSMSIPNFQASNEGAYDV